MVLLYENIIIGRILSDFFFETVPTERGSMRGCIRMVEIHANTNFLCQEDGVSGRGMVQFACDMISYEMLSTLEKA